MQVSFEKIVQLRMDEIQKKSDDILEDGIPQNVVQKAIYSGVLLGFIETLAIYKELNKSGKAETNIVDIFVKNKQ